MIKDRIQKDYWWEINAFYENGMTVDDLIGLLVQVYRDGHAEGEEEGYASGYEAGVYGGD